MPVQVPLRDMIFWGNPRNPTTMNLPRAMAMTVGFFEALTIGFLLFLITNFSPPVTKVEGLVSHIFVKNCYVHFDRCAEPERQVVSPAWAWTTRQLWTRCCRR